MQQKYLFCFKFEFLKVQPCWFALPTKSRKFFACDKMDVDATHTGQVHDVSYLVKMAASKAIFVTFSVSF